MIKRNLIAGALVWVPIWFTIVVVKFLLDLFDKAWAMVPLDYQPYAVFGFDIPGVSVILAAALVWVTGLLVTNFIGQYIIKFYESLLDRIPVVRSVYQTAKQASSVIFSSQKSAFNQVLLIQYPRQGIWSIAFKTNDGLDQSEKLSGQKMVTVFLPTTPNPTSGFLLLIPENDIKEIDWSVEAALKYIVSLGTVYNQ